MKNGTYNGETLIQNLTLYGDGNISNVSLINTTSTHENFEGEEIPPAWENLKAEKHEPTNDTLTEEDWKFLRESMTDLSEEEKDKLLSEFKEIIEGKSTLSKEEQSKICQKVGHYIIEATEGSGIQPKWAGSRGHQEISQKVGPNLDTIYMSPYMTSGHSGILGSNYSWRADEHRGQPPLFGLWNNSHSWVTDDTDILTIDNYGTDSCEYFMDHSRTNFTQYDVDSAYVDISKGLHYIEDLGCPFHTTGILNFFYQIHHADYEKWVSDNWGQLESATAVDTYYIIKDPSDAAKALASFSNQHLVPIDNIMDQPDWQNSTDLINDTRTLLSETEKMTIGMHVYASKFESPDTIGSNSVPVRDFNTSYAYINDTACSESMMLPIKIEHSHIGDLEVWISWWDPSSTSYLEQKIWDRQGESADKLWLLVHAEGLQDEHNWRLRVVDSAAGDEGTITEIVEGRPHTSGKIFIY